MSSANPWIKGHCPMGCGRTLFAGNGGYITCSLIGCPNPVAAHELLHIDPEVARALIRKAAS